MYNLNEIKRIIIDSMNKVNEVKGTNLELNIPVELNGRLSKSLGYFESNAITPIKISISKKLLALSEETIVDTIKHETAHYIAFLIHGESCGHDKRWKDICNIIGCVPSPYANLSQQDNQKYMETYKYTITCNGCGAKTHMNRMGKQKTDDFKNGRYCCNKCKSHSFNIKQNH